MNLPPDSIVRLGSGAITRRDALPTPARRCIEAIRSSFISLFACIDQAFSMPANSKSLLKRLAVDLAKLCSNPDELDHAFDLLNASYGTDVAQAARNRLKEDPSIQPLIAEQYWGEWPSLSDLRSMPAGSLGHVYGTFMASQGLNQLPNPQLGDSVSCEDTYLQHRIRHTHDIWHVIAGLPITMAGEAAANGLTTEQLRWPGSALLISADLIHRVSESEASQTKGSDRTVDLGVAVAYGLSLGARAKPLLAQRWEEGWERPLSDWRDALGISDLIAQSPFPPLAGDRSPLPSATIVGSWSLESLTIRDAGGAEAVPIWGEQPLGQLTYTADERMSAVLCKAGRSTRSPSAGAADVAEQADLFRHSYGYAGRYSLTAAGVVHHVEVAADPNWIGTDQHRITHLENDQLTITTTAIPSVVSPDPVSYEAIWRKLPSAQAAIPTPR